MEVSCSLRGSASPGTTDDGLQSPSAVVLAKRCDHGGRPQSDFKSLTHQLAADKAELKVKK